MSPVVAPRAGVLVVPVLVIDRYLHFRWVPVVHTITAAIVIVAAKVLWIEDVWVVVEPRTVSISCGRPSWSVSHWLGSIRIAVSATRITGPVRS